MKFLDDEIENGKYKNLKKFLDDNELKLRSSMLATDIWQAFKIVSKDYRAIGRSRSRVHICFFYEAYEGSMFSWSLTNRPCMDEDEFIEKIKGILESDNQYVPYLAMED